MEKLLGTLWAAHCVAQKQNPALSLEDEKPPDIIYEISSSFFWPLRLILRAYLKFRTPDRLPMFKPNYFGKREVLGAYSQLKARQKFHVDKMVLTDALPHFDVIARMREHRPDYDEVTVGMCSMFETWNIPLWLTLALRVFLDIHHELDGKTQRAYQELEGATNYFEKTMTEIQSSQTTYKPANWPSSGDKFLQDFVDELRFMHSSDQIQEFVSERTDNESPDYNFVSESHHLLKYHPLSCGIKLYAVRAKYHDLSVKYANAAGTVISCAHLYHALKTEKFLASTWPDMELFLHIHESDQIFAGCVPRKPRAYLFQYSTLLRKVSSACPQRVLLPVCNFTTIQHNLAINLWLLLRTLPDSSCLDMSMVSDNVILYQSKHRCSREKEKDAQFNAYPTTRPPLIPKIGSIPCVQCYTKMFSNSSSITSSFINPAKSCWARSRANCKTLTFKW
jgi:hypothetical protein